MVLCLLLLVALTFDTNLPHVEDKADGILATWNLPAKMAHRLSLSRATTIAAVSLL
jgi:hypothetical protein